MNRSVKCIVAGVMLLTTGGAWSQSLQLDVRMDKDTYVLGEPIYLSASLTNVGRETLSVMPLLTPDLGLIDVQIASVEGRQVGFFPLSIVDVDIEPVSLDFGQSLHATFPVFFGSRGWTITEPGTFTIRAMYRHIVAPGEVSEIVSDEMKIRVEQDPTGASSFLFKGQTAEVAEAGKFLTWQSGDHLVAGRSHLMALVAQFPESILSSYIRLSFAVSQSRPFTNYIERRVRPANEQDCLASLSKVDVEALLVFLRIQARVVEATCLHGVGRSAEAVKVVAVTREHFSKRPELEAFAERLSDLERMR